MAVNMYDQPTQAEFINTYVPIPFQDILQAGANKQQNYDVHKSAYDKMAEEAENLRYIKGTKDEQYINSTVIPTMRELSDQYAGKDYGSTEVVNEINRVLREKINKGLVNRIQESASAYDVYQQGRNKLQTEGTYNPAFDRPFDNWKGTEEGGIFNYSTPKMLDYNEPAIEYFKYIDDSILGKVDPVTGEFFTGVGMNKIKEVAKGNIDSYLKDPAGKQMVQEYRYRTGDTQTSNEDIAYNFLTDVGERFTRSKRQFAPESYLKGRSGGEPEGNQYFRQERTPMVPVDGKSLTAEDFKQQTQTQASGFQGSVPYVGGDPFYKNTLRKSSFYNEHLLTNPEVQSLVKLMPKEYRDQYEKLVNNTDRISSPEAYKEMQSNFFSKLEHAYGQLDKDLKQGAYLNAYYPSKVEGNASSYINNSDFQTKYLFGTTGKISELGSGNIVNKDFINLKTGESVSGKEFYDDVISKLKKKDPNSQITVTGEYDMENPFVAKTGNSNFSTAYQVTVNGEQYVVSGSVTDPTDPLLRYKQAANETYSKVRYNKGVPIDEGDGTIKQFKTIKIPINGVIFNEKDPNTFEEKDIYEIRDEDTKQIIIQTPDFKEAYHVATMYKNQ
jgi:hypothetical protein